MQLPQGKDEAATATQTDDDKKTESHDEKEKVCPSEEEKRSPTKTITSGQPAVGKKVDAFLKWLRSECIAAVDIPASPAASPSKKTPAKQNEESVDQAE